MANPAKIGKVMGEYKRRTLKSSSGEKVVDRAQALAIAMSEAGMSRKKGKKAHTSDLANTIADAKKSSKRR